MDVGSYRSEARSWSDTPPGAEDSRQDMAAVFTPGGKGRLPVIGAIDIRLAHRLPREPAEGHSPHCFFDKF